MGIRPWNNEDTARRIFMEKQKKESAVSVIWKWAGGEQKNFILSIILAVIGVIGQMLSYLAAGVRPR